MNLTPRTFIVKYEVRGHDGYILKEGIIKAKRKTSNFEAKAGVGGYLEKKWEGQYKSIEIISCKDEIGMNDIFSQFGDIFGKGGDSLKNSDTFNDIFKFK